MSYTDIEIVKKIREDRNNLKLLYDSCKEKSIPFLQKMTTGSAVSRDDLNDVFQESMIVFYENIIKADFTLTSTIQTYINSVCKNQLLKRFRYESKKVEKDIKQLHYDASITDELEEIDESDDFFKAVDKAFKQLKGVGGKCYKLLMAYWYENNSMKQLTERFEYTNSNNTKNQKARCQKKLKEFAYQNLAVK